MQKKGFTLVEILIVIAILGILVGIVVTSFATFRSVQGLDKDSETVVEVLQQARSQTLVSQNASQYGVHFASSTVTLFTGTTYVPGSSTNQDYLLVGSDTVLSLSLTGNGTNVVFARLNGETAQNGTIVLSSQTSGRTRTVTIYKTGLVQFK